MVALPGMVTEPTGLTATRAATVTPVAASTAEAVPKPPLIRPATAPNPAPALPSAKSGPAASADLVVESSDETLLALLARRATPRALTEAGALRLEGDERLLDAVPEVFRFAAAASEDAVA